MTKAESGAELTREGEVTSRTLRIEGALPPGWVGRVAAGLAARSISIVRARARRLGPVAWKGEFVVSPLPGAQVERIDLAALATASGPGAGASTRVRLSGFRVAEAPDEIVVEIRAPDEVGLLDRVLGVFAMFGLFPREMDIDTRGCEAHDRFHLRAFGDRSPPPELATALRGMLERLAS